MPPYGPHSFKLDPSISGLTESLISYHDSNKYINDVEKIVGYAMNYLQTLEVGNDSLAIILDIDETSLMSDWDTILNPKTTFDPNKWNSWVNAAKAEPMLPTLELFNKAREMNIEVFF